MIQENKSVIWPINWPVLLKPAIIGAAIALTLMIIFLWGVQGNPAWGQFWKVRPFVVITFAGAGGGLFYYVMNALRARGGWRRAVAEILSIIVYIIGLWLGTVVGLDGTLWH